MNPLISVIMPVYNCEPYVGDAVQSILRQTFEDFELIIIDDASTDRTLQIIKDIHDERITIIEKPQNTGYTNSLNLGLQLARGKYIARMDGDDVSLPERFKKQVDFFQTNPEIVLCGSWIETLDGKRLIRLPVRHDEIGIAFLEINPFAHSAVMFKKEIMEENGLSYHSDLEPAEDYALWIEFFKLGQVANLPEVLVRYREFAQQVSVLRKDTQENNSQKIRNNLLKMLYGGKLPSINVLNQPAFKNGFPEENKKTFESFLFELSKVEKLNEEQKFFDRQLFKNFCARKKHVFIKNYFLKLNEFNSRKLLNFLSPDNCFFRHFTNAEKIKVILQSFLSFLS